MRGTRRHVRESSDANAFRLPSAGGLPALGKDADRVRAIKSLAVPSRGGGIGRDMSVLLFKGPRVRTCLAAKRCAEVATVGTHEAEPAPTGSEDFELTRVVGCVMAFAQQQQIA
jgi:hypothetical protein